jgi:hypothetical protein
MKRRVLIIGAVVVGVAIAGGIAGRGPKGQDSAGAAVDEYLAALSNGDRDRLKRVADPDHDSDQVAAGLIDQYGAGRLTVAQKHVLDERHIRITGRLNGDPYEQTLELAQHGGRWYVVLGPARTDNGENAAER